MTTFSGTRSDSVLESLQKMQVAHMLEAYAQEATLGDKKSDDCRLKLMVRRHLEQKSKILCAKREIETGTDLR